MSIYVEDSQNTKQTSAQKDHHRDWAVSGFKNPKFGPNSLWLQLKWERAVRGTLTFPDKANVYQTQEPVFLLSSLD